MNKVTALIAGLLLGLALLAGSAFGVAAQGGLKTPPWQLGGPPFPITNAATTEYAPAVAYNPTRDNTLVVWQDEDPTSDRKPTSIRARIVNGADNSLGDVITLAQSSVVGQRVDSHANAVIAYNSVADEYFVIWIHTQSNGTQPPEILGARVSGDGSSVTPVGALVSLPASTSQFQNIRLAFSPNNAAHAPQRSYLLVWEERQSLTGTIKGAFVSQSGQPANSILQIGFPNGSAGQSCFDQTQPDVAWSDSNAKAFLVVWSKWTSALPGAGCNGGDEYRIWGRQISDGGAFLDDDPRLISDNSPDSQTHHSWPAVAFNPSLRQWLVVWLESRAGQALIYSQNIPVGATTRLPDDVQIPDTHTQISRPALVWADAAQQFFLGWYDTLDGQQYRGVVWNGVGQPTTQSFLIYAAADPNQYLSQSADGPVAAYDTAHGQVFAVWDMNTAGTTNGDIWGQLVTYVPPAPTTTPTVTQTSTPEATVTPTATATQAGPPFVTIEGVVQACTGAPLPYADVRILNTPYRDVTESDGSYSIGPLLSFPAGQYTIEASAEGRATVTQTVTLSPRTTPYEINFTGNACLGPAPTATATATVTATTTATTTATATATTSATTTATVTATATATATTTRTPTPSPTPPVYHSYLPYVTQEQALSTPPA